VTDRSPLPLGSTSRMFSSATVLAAGNVASRLLGLVREQVIAGFFATSLEASALRAALRVPTMIYDLLIGGMLSAALVPVLSAYATTRRAELWRALSVLLSASAVVTGVVGGLLFFLAGPAARLLAGGLSDPGVTIVATSLRWLSPAVLAFGLSGTITGALYALERFHRPAAAGAVYNLALIATLVAMHDRLGPYALPLGVTIGALSQVLVLAPGLRGGSIRFVLALRHPVVRRVLVLYAPVALGLAVTQVQVWIDTRLASQAGESALSAMGYGTNLIQFPHGLVAVAISIAILPAMSGAHARSDEDAFARTLARGLRAVLALSLPAAVGLAVLAGPVVGSVFQHGAFGDSSRQLVTIALWGYVLGLPFASVDWPLNYAFYARQDTLTPALVGIFSVGVYLVVAVAFGPTLNLAGLDAPIVFLGLVLADSAKQASHLVAMVALTRRRIGAAALSGTGRALAASAAAALVMGLAVFGVDRLLAGTVDAGKAAWVLRSVVGAGLGAAIYLPLAARLGVPEITWLLDVLRAKVRFAR